MAKIVQLREDITPEGATEKVYRNGYPRTIPQGVIDPATGETLPQVLEKKADLVGGKVPSGQLPSYVDDVVEVATFASLPATGEQGKIYIATDTNAQYRWTGTAYRNISNPVDFATQEEAEGNSENTKAMTSLRVFQNFIKNVISHAFSTLNTTAKTLIGSVNELFDRLNQVDESMAQLAGDVTVKDAVHSDKIKDIENVISTMNPNQSAQLSVSGRKTISLPKNAANGGMSVKLEGLTAENLVVNGNFENGLIAPFFRSDGGGGASTLAINSSTPISGNYDVRFTVTTPSTTVGRPVLWGLQGVGNIGDKIYLHFYAKILSGIPSIRQISDGASANLIYAGDVINGRNTRIIDLVGTGDAGAIYFNSFSVWDMQMDNFVRINLTETFGKGNEPTKEQCDLMFADYFEGVKSFEPTGRVRSVGRNLVYEEWEKGAIASNGDLIPSVNEIRIKNPIKVMPQQSYVGLNTTGTPVYAYYSSEKVQNSTTLLMRTVAQTHISPAGSKVCIVKINSITLVHKFQIEMGTIPSPYEPYRETSLYLTAPELRSNGTVKDEIRKGANGYELVKRISDVDGSVLTTPEITPISYGGVLNSASNGTVYHEPIIADAGVYETNLPILMQDYPIATIEEIIKHENGIDTYLNVATAVIASDGLSFTHPDLADGDLVLFTYAFDKESTNGNITATFYDSNVVKIDTVTGKAYRINEVVTNGVLTRTLTEV